MIYYDIKVYSLYPYGFNTIILWTGMRVALVVSGMLYIIILVKILKECIRQSKELLPNFTTMIVPLSVV